MSSRGASPRLIWALNPDAERELASRSAYTPNQRLLRQIAERRRLFDALTLGEPAFFMEEFPAPSRALGEASLVACWCPTPNLTRRLADLGWTTPRAPSLETLRRVHDKAFLSEDLSAWTVEGHRTVASHNDWNEARANLDGALRCKRRFGFAGKGQRVIPEALSRDDMRWLDDSLADGGLVVERQLDAAIEISIHGVVDADGILPGSACRLATDRHGAPESVVPLVASTKDNQEGSPDRRDESLLNQSVMQAGIDVAEALSSAGYSGPYGIDLLVGQEGPRLIDINPRFTLGWSVGLGDKREEALERYLGRSLDRDHS